MSPTASKRPQITPQPEKVPSPTFQQISLTACNERNSIKRFFNNLKQSQHINTGCDKFLFNFNGFVKIAAILLKQIDAML